MSPLCSDGGASYEGVPRLGTSVQTASDQVSAPGADDPCARGWVKRVGEKERSFSLRNNFHEMPEHMGETIKS
jgi:hypothetical protein